MNAIHIEETRYGNWALVKSTLVPDQSTRELWLTNQSKSSNAYIELEHAQLHVSQMASIDTMVFLTPYERPAGTGVFPASHLGPHEPLIVRRA